MKEKSTFTRQLLEVVIASILAFPVSIIINFWVATTQAIMIVGISGLISTITLLFVHSVMTYKNVIMSARTKVIVHGEVVVHGDSSWDTRFFATWCLTVLYWGPLVSIIFNRGYLNVSNSNTLMAIEAVVLVFGFIIGSEAVKFVESSKGSLQLTAFEVLSAVFIGMICAGIMYLSYGVTHIDFELMIFDIVFAGVLYWHLSHKGLE